MKVVQKLFRTSLSIMVLTLIHHAYGAVIYEQSFRLHVAYFTIPVILILILGFRIYQNYPSKISGKIAFGVFMVTTAIIPVGMIGLYEGGYNHLVKNILYFGSIHQTTLDQLFPPPLYEMPNDFLFEATGIFQFILGVYGVYYLVAFWKEK